MNKKVSIILPTKNGAKNIGKSISSVLNQTYKNIELIIVNDGSTDNTQEIISQCQNNDQRIICINNQVNIGIQKSLNIGIENSTGDYIARIDDDDSWTETEKLQKQVDFMKSNPDFGLVGTGAILIYEKGTEINRYLLPELDIDIRKRILAKNCFVHSAVLIRKSILDQTGLYSEDNSKLHVEDHDLWLRIGEKTKFANISDYAVTLTISENSITSKNRVNQAKKMIILACENRKKYPNFYINYMIGIIRYAFFIIASFFPINRKLIYKIQAFVREV